VRGRPLLHTSYEEDQAIFPTTTQRVLLVVVLLVAITLPLRLIPGLRWLGGGEWLVVLDRAFIFAIAALGLNLLTGIAGQVSLGHAFFMGIGAYTAVLLGGEPTATLRGFELPMWIWLPAAGLVAAFLGVVVAPTAVRVRGLYLAFVTLGLVFIGEHIFRNVNSIAGPLGLGRRWPPLELKIWKEQEPLVSFSQSGRWLGIDLSSRATSFYFLLALLVAFTLVHKNIARSRVGRAFAAIRDRDIAAEVMGVDEARYKTLAFAISSFFAGIAGALLAAFFGQSTPEAWNLLLSVQFIAIILIGGAGTTLGTLLGSFFVVAIPRLVETGTRLLQDSIVEGGVMGAIGDVLISTGSGDFGLVGAQAVGPGLSVFQANLLLYGVLIIVFLIFEPLGLFGIWLRIRNYWKGWPFTY
jgi:branched-chain amino acid transport system permease protein